MNLNPFESDKVEHFSTEGVDGLGYSTLLELTTKKVEWSYLGGTHTYQGDIISFGKAIDGSDKVYISTFGYGSCSGCDSLASCESYVYDEVTGNHGSVYDEVEVNKIIDSLKRGIREFDNVKAFVDWFNEYIKYEYLSSYDLKPFMNWFNSKNESQIYYDEGY